MLHPERPGVTDAALEAGRRWVEMSKRSDKSGRGAIGDNLSGLASLRSIAPMAENKRQHFVPKFYLRNFGSPDGGSVGVYNIASGRIVHQAKLKTQAYRDYFYGKDGRAERWMGGIEGPASQAIATIVTTGKAPKPRSRDHFKLIYFLVLQLARTVRAEEEANARIDMIAKAMLKHQMTDPKMIAALDRVKIGEKEAVVGAVDRAIVGAPALYDLAFKLIDNQSPVAFITSDHPAARHNQLLEGLADLDTVGTGAAGLQLLLPLSPRYALLFYDDYAYAVGGRGNPIVRVTVADYVNQLNGLQWYESKDNLYFSSLTQEADLRQAAQDYGRFRLQKPEWVEDTLVSLTETQKRVRFAYHAPTRPLRLDVPFIRLRGPRPKFQGWDQVPMRFPEWMMFLSELGSDLHHGEITDDEYQRWTARYPTLRKDQRRVRGSWR